MGPCCAKSTIPRMHKWRPSIFAALHFASLPGNECHLLDVDSGIKDRARRGSCTTSASITRVHNRARWRRMDIFFFNERWFYFGSLRVAFSHTSLDIYEWHLGIKEGEKRFETIPFSLSCCKRNNHHIFQNPSGYSKLDEPREEFA